MEEQQEEIEILQSIYPDELEVYTPNSYVINLALDTAPPRGITVDVDYPPTYPAEAIPVIKLGVFEVSEPEDGKKGEIAYSHDFSPEDLSELTEQAREWAEENIGMPSVFTVVSQLKDAAEELYNKRVADKEASHLQELAIAEEKEQAKFKGTKVTPESFAAWRKKFRHEMGWDKPVQRTALTGKEIFVRGIAGDDDDVGEV